MIEDIYLYRLILKIQNLFLDLSIINNKHVIVDEVPDEIFKGLIAGKSYTFEALPEEEKEPKDEKTIEFKTAYEIAQKEDEVY